MLNKSLASKIKKKECFSKKKGIEHISLVSE